MRAIPPTSNAMRKTRGLNRPPALVPDVSTRASIWRTRRPSEAPWLVPRRPRAALVAASTCRMRPPPMELDAAKLDAIGRRPPAPDWKALLTHDTRTYLDALETTPTPLQAFPACRAARFRMRRTDAHHRESTTDAVPGGMVLPGTTTAQKQERHQHRHEPGTRPGKRQQEHIPNTPRLCDRESPQPVSAVNECAVLTRFPYENAGLLNASHKFVCGE